MRRAGQKIALAISTTAIAAMGIQTVRAANYAWIGSGGDGVSWDDAANWGPVAGIPGTSTSDNVTLGPGAPVTFSINMNSAKTIRNLYFTTGGWTVGGTDLTISWANAGGRALSVSGGAVTISAAVHATTTSALTSVWEVADGATLVITGAINNGSSGATAIPKIGDGVMRIAGSTANVANTAANSAWQVKAGVLELDRTGTAAMRATYHGISGTGTTRLLQNAQFIGNDGTTANSQVYIGEADTLDLNGHDQTLQTVRLASTITSGSGNSAIAGGGGTVQTAAGTLTLTATGGAIRYDGDGSAGTNTTGIVSGNVNFSSTGGKTIAVNNGQAAIDLSISANLSASTVGTFGFAKGTVGLGTSGTIALSGVNTISNAISISDAVRVLVNTGGNLGTTSTTTDAVAVTAAATLGGNGGAVYGNVSVSGHVAPGSVNASGVSTVGTLTAGHALQAVSVAFGSGSTFDADVSGSLADLLNVIGTLSFDGTTLAVTSISPTSTEYEIASATGGITVLSAFNVTGATGYQVRNGGTELWVVGVPEPTSLSVVMLGAASLLSRRKRRGRMG